jgi:hypothetical protein
MARVKKSARKAEAAANVEKANLESAKMTKKAAKAVKADAAKALQAKKVEAQTKNVKTAVLKKGKRTDKEDAATVKGKSSVSDFSDDDEDKDMSSLLQTQDADFVLSGGSGDDDEDEEEGEGEGEKGEEEKQDKKKKSNSNKAKTKPKKKKTYPETKVDVNFGKCAEAKQHKDSFLYFRDIYQAPKWKSGDHPQVIGLTLLYLCTNHIVADSYVTIAIRNALLSGT